MSPVLALSFPISSPLTPSHRRIKLGFPADLRRTALEDVQLLSPGQEMRFPMEVVLAGAAGKSFRLDIRTDKGAYAAQLTPEPWELVTPAAMSPTDFDTFRQRFSGLGESVKTFPLSSLGLGASAAGGVAAVELELVSRFRRLVNVHTVQGPGYGELMFAGSKKEMGKEERVLLSASTTR